MHGAKLFFVILCCLFSSFVWADWQELAKSEVPRSHWSEGFQFPTGEWNKGTHLNQGLGETWEGGTGHLGDDYRAAEGESVFACASGLVIYSEVCAKWGGVVVAKHWLPAEKLTVFSQYAHVKCLVKAGDLIQRGDKVAEIAKVDPWRPHLHFEIKNWNGQMTESSVAGRGYSGKDGYAPNRYSPIDFVKSHLAGSKEVKPFVRNICPCWYRSRVYYVSELVDRIELWSCELDGTDARLEAKTPISRKIIELATWRDHLVAVIRTQNQPDQLKLLDTQEILFEGKIDLIAVNEKHPVIAVFQNNNILGIKPGAKARPIQEILATYEWQEFVGSPEIWTFTLGGNGAKIRFISRKYDYIVSVISDNFEYSAPFFLHNNGFRPNEPEQMVFASNRSGSWQIWQGTLVAEANGEKCTKCTFSKLKQITSKGQSQEFSIINPEHILYVSTESGSEEIHTINVDGKDRVRLTYGTDRKKAEKYAKKKAVEKTAIGILADKALEILKIND